MAAAVSHVETFPSLSRSDSVRIDAAETWVALAKTDRARAERAMRDAIVPHLVHRDDVDALALALAPRLLYAPFWRVKLAVEAVHPRSSPCVISIANIAFPLPPPSTGGQVGGRAGVMMISARTSVPYTPRLPSFFGGTDALEVQRPDLVPLTSESAIDVLWEEEIVDPDVDRATGERIAASSLAEMLGRKAKPRVESTMCALYPLWHASFGDDDEHFVLLSALDARVVSARFPRRPTISERVKRLFT